jgi:hypothetical protein
VMFYKRCIYSIKAPIFNPNVSVFIIIGLPFVYLLTPVR